VVLNEKVFINVSGKDVDVFGSELYRDRKTPKLLVPPTKTGTKQLSNMKTAGGPHHDTWWVGTQLRTTSPCINKMVHCQLKKKVNSGQV
jgi:hypothetical protein